MSSLKIVLRAGIVSLALAIGNLAPANAQDLVEEQRNYTIPAGPLAQALNQFASQAGITLFFDPALVAGKSAPALNGDYSFRQGLRVLLENSGLTIVEDENAGAYKLARIAMESGVIELDTINIEAVDYREDRVVGASKIDQALIDAPQNVQIVNRARIEDQGLNDINSLANLSASVSVADGGRIIIRGFDQRADQNDYLRVDGLKGRSAAPTQPVSLANVERVEILKGANSVLYGAGIEGGVINLITKKPEAAAQKNFTAEVGSYGLKRLSADLTGSVNDDKSVRYRLVAEGMKDGLQFEHSDRRDIFIAPSLEWLGNDTSVLVQLEHRDSEQTPSYWGRTGVYPDGELDRRFAEQAYHSDGDFDKNKGNAIASRVSHFLDGGQELVGSVRYAEFNEQYRAHFGVLLDPDGRTLHREMYDSDNDINSLSVSLYTVMPFSTGGLGEHKVLAGMDYEQYEGEQSSFWGWWDGTTPSIDIYDPDYSDAGPLPPEADRFAFDYVYKTKRFYLQDNIEFDEQWSAVVGITSERADQNETDGQTYTGKYDYNQVTKRVGVVYKTMPGHALFAAYSEGFKPSSIWQNQPMNGGPFDPQELAQYEAGYQYESADKRLGLVASIYSIEKTNIPYRLPGAGAGDPFYANTVKSQGLELDVTGQLSTRLFVQAGYAYHDGKITESENPEQEGLRQYDSNRHKLSLWARYNLASVPGLGLSAGVVHRADIAPNSNDITPEDYTIIDLGALYTLRGGQWQFAFNIKNAMDELYVPTVQDGTFSSAGYGMPRSYYLTVRSSF